MPIGDFNRRELLDSARSSAGFGGIRPTSFGSTVDSSTNISYRSPFDPRNDPNDPWARKGAGPGFTPPEPTTAPEPEPESQPQTFFERFPTPQDAWQDWIKRMGQFLARQPGETPNFPGPWGAGPFGSGGAPTTPGPRGIEEWRGTGGEGAGYGAGAGGSGGRFMGGRAPVPGGSRGPDFQNIRLM
ncbi:hypothetical protein LCGC14_2331530 [marine sediment metagenome]|uniref:Uncharacterized protein n=1 Tax=marine sediment metagenome TaxID=412755 RepID=A0A0F9ESG0_9ZZZZ